MKHMAQLAINGIYSSEEAVVPCGSCVWFPLIDENGFPLIEMFENMADR